MRVRTHLISMPWAPTESPSIQIGCLKAHLDRALGGRSDCRGYSAFFSILLDFRGRDFEKACQEIARYREYVYQALYLRRFGPAEFRGTLVIPRIFKGRGDDPISPLSLSMLNGLEQATCRFLDRDLAPHLIARGLNLVAFTLNYDQVYASLYAAEHLRRRFPERHFLFVYGGCSAALPNVRALLQELDVPGVIVIGEGELNLERVVRTCESLQLSKARTALTAVGSLDPGIIVIGEPVDLRSHNPARYASQTATLRQLPVPDYDEYFGLLRRACIDAQTDAAFRAATDVLVEGSRGCFGRCDFCGLNRTWRGFRTRTAGEVAHDTRALARKYGSVHIVFVDSVCDAWAEDYARMLVDAGRVQKSPMELKAHHPESFWTLLALAGVEAIQVGIEALSSPLLRAMGKGTTAVQNLAAHKYLAELGIRSRNNLIGHHPASTLADIRETRRILQQIPHWAPLNLVRFVLMPGSPLYEGLTPHERGALKPIRSFRVPARFVRYAVEGSFEVPTRLKPPPDVMQAWNAFARDYARAKARHEVERPRLDVVRVAPDALRITDTRDGGMQSYDLCGDAARIYEACHAGLKVDEVADATGFSRQIVTTALARFLRRRLVLRVDDRYLSLALRPRDELLHRLFAARAGSVD